jgi:hypothetical protein
MKDRVWLDFPDTDEVIFKNEQSELVIYLDDGTPLLSQAVSFFADTVGGGKPTRPTFIVDALTGEIVFEYEGLTHDHCNDCLAQHLSGKIRKWYYNSFTVPDPPNGELLEISISGGSGDADLYVVGDAYANSSGHPDLSTYSCRPYLNGNNEKCSMPTNSLDGPMWQIGIYAYRSYSDVDLRADVKSLTHQLGTGPGGNGKTGEYRYGPHPAEFAPLDVVSIDPHTTCIMDNANVKTVDLDHGTSGSTAFEYPCLENTHQSINGAFSPLNDAHFFGGVVYDMYNSYLEVPPLNFQLTMRVHYGTNYENAFWNGSSMTFGDGGSTFYPLVGLDVSAHEVSHGFTEQNSGLIYSGQSGGINEAFSDIAGEAAKFFMRGPNEFDFLVGAEIFKGDGALRYMCNPPQDGLSIDDRNDYYNGLDVHYSSGVFNKAFCLLATTTGWDTEMAFKAFAKANRLYWTPSTNFDEGAQGVVDAAGDQGFDEQDVIDAFEVVGIYVLGPPEDLTPPDAPTGLTATAGDGSVALGWDTHLDPDNDLDSYNVYRGTSSGSHAWIATVGDSEYNDDGLTNDDTYYYVVTAVDTSDNESADSGEISATPTGGGGAAVSMHVEAILLDTVNTGQGWKQGTAEVTVFDNLGNPVDGVDVAGTFVDNVTGSTTGTTGGSGAALLTSTGVPKKGKVNFTFCVDTIVDIAGLNRAYNSAVDVEVCPTF